jgi:hypothetical protein
MKPIKNRFFCKDCGKIKMLFDTEKKAYTFIKFNSNEIENEMGYKPERSYFCEYCGGWHVTSKKENLTFKSKTEKVLDLYEQEKEKKILEKEKRALLQTEKQEKLKEKFEIIEKCISILERTEKDTGYYREKLNQALQELELAKNIGWSSREMVKKRNRIEEVLNRLGAENT